MPGAVVLLVNVEAGRRVCVCVSVRWYARRFLGFLLFLRTFFSRKTPTTVSRVVFEFGRTSGTSRQPAGLIYRAFGSDVTKKNKTPPFLPADRFGRRRRGVFVKTRARQKRIVFRKCTPALTVRPVNGPGVNFILVAVVNVFAVRPGDRPWRSPDTPCGPPGFSSRQRTISRFNRSTRTFVYPNGGGRFIKNETATPPPPKTRIEIPRDGRKRPKWRFTTGAFTIFRRPRTPTLFARMIRTGARGRIGRVSFGRTGFIITRERNIVSR